MLDPYFAKPAGTAEFEAAVEGRTIADVGRRGKYLVFEFDDRNSMVIHLRMTGSITLLAPDGTANPGDARIYPVDGVEKHLKARFELDDGGEIRFADPRRFGRGFVAGPEDLESYFEARLGLEPLSPEFTAEALAEMSAGRTGPLKSFLLDQKGVAGIGNIYADEALWRAGIHGERPADALTAPRIGQLLDHAADVMRAALEQGGTSFDALYVNVNGASGYFDRSLAAYGQAGRPCPRCGTPIRREQFMNRSSYSCPRCQPRPRGVGGR